MRGSGKVRPMPFAANRHGETSAMSALSNRIRPLLGRNTPEDHVEQRRLARAIGADHAARSRPASRSG